MSTRNTKHVDKYKSNDRVGEIEDFANKRSETIKCRIKLTHKSRYKD
jgi:hypothetical protein